MHDLPDFVYFNHSIHVKKGVGCETCHGRVDQMPLMLAGQHRCRWSGASTATAIPRTTSGRASEIYDDGVRGRAATAVGDSARSW